MKLTLQLVTWNGAHWLPGLFASLKQCRVSDVRCQMSILDNGSTDGTVEILKKELATPPFSHQLIELKENTGFAGGHNRLFRMSSAEYVLIFNQDMEFEPDCIQKLVQCLDTHPDAAAVAPKLMRLDDKTKIDSLGLKKYRNWRVVDSHVSNVSGQVSSDIFGVSGACAMFRMSAVRPVAFPDGMIFDESYGSYKEDVDLAFRMKRKGLRSFVLNDVVAYHARGSGNGKKDQPTALRYQSYRNHLATIFKNFSRRDFLDFPFVLCYETVKVFWYILFDRKVLGAWADLWRMRKKLYERRHDCLR